MKDRVLLINPNRMRPVVAPLGLDYLSSSIADNKIDFEVLDLAFFDNIEKEIKRFLKGRDFTAIAVTVRNIDDSYFFSRDFCLKKIKETIDLVKIHSTSPIILGGVGFSIAPIPVLKYCGVKLGIWGEGELSLPLLIKSLAAGRDIDTIPGLVHKKDNRYRMNPPFFIDLQKICLSQRNALNNRRYYREGGMIGFETKRGCDQTCYYCADPIAKGKKVRVRNPKDVADELAGLLEKGIACFHTCDSEFNLPENHAIEVCKEIVKQRLGNKIIWYAYATPSGFSDELAAWMKEAGCVGIDFGIDSGNERMLKNLGRNHTPEDINKVAALCHKHGFVFMFDLLLGGPGEDRKTLSDTLNLMKQLNPSRVGISLGIRIYPGTYFGKVLGKEMQSSLKGFFGESNIEMLKPLYYLSPDLGDDIQDYIKKLIGGDSRFFFGGLEKIEANYNYNDNTRLVEAIKKGHKGAFWDILRRIDEEE